MTLLSKMAWGTVLPLLILARAAPAAPSFSIDLASPSFPGVSNSALLGPGPVGGPPTVLGGPGSLGLSGGATDEINAMTNGGSFGTLHFSVTRSSTGAAGSVVPQATLGQAAGDLFSSRIDGTNALAFNQRALGLLPSIGSGSATTPPIDDLDALDFTAIAPPIAFALASGHGLLGTAVGCGGDIFFDGNPGGLFFGYPMLGLGSCADDIDGFHVALAQNKFYYSLTPGSPSLAAGSPIGGCAAGCSAADIFVSDLTGSASLFASAASLGLAATDDIDALAWDDVTVVDTPALDATGIALLSAVLLALGARYTVARAS